jgi:hypothetical protein
MLIPENWNTAEKSLNVPCLPVAEDIHVPFQEAGRGPYSLVQVATLLEKD